jgi:Putative auto-transporter adhesin, head GIN domain
MKKLFLLLALCTGFSSMLKAQVLYLTTCDFAVVLQYGNVALPRLSGTAQGISVSLQQQSDGTKLVCGATASQNKLSDATASSNATVVSGTRVNRAIGKNAVAEQNIGGQNSARQTGQKSQSVVIMVPSAWRIQARDWVGSLRAETGVWQVDMEIAAGEMSFAQLKDSRLVLDAGSVTAQSLQGRLDAHIRGAGDIEVMRSNDAQLYLQLTGAGSMSFKGRAQSAVIRASGVGSVEIEKVATEPKVTASSLASIDIGR